MSANTVPYPSAVPVSHDARLSVSSQRAMRISWPAVLAGAVVALAVQIVLAMLGTGIGASTVDPLVTDASPSASAFGIGAAVWWGVSSLLALYFGGWVASRLSGMLRPVDGALHGLLTWAVALLVMVYLVSSAAGSLVSGAAGMLGTAAKATAAVSAAAAPKIADAAGEQLSQSGITFDSVKSEALKLLSQTGKPALQPGSLADQAGKAVTEARQAAGNPPATEQDYSAMLQRVLTAAQGTASQADRDALINVVAARTGISREEATQRVDSWTATANEARAKAAQTAEQAKQKAREVADATAKGVSRAALLGCLVLALGGLAAWMGGLKGWRRAGEAAVLHRDLHAGAPG